ncbi:MAG: hypothetical protein ABF904_11690 [Ethanoligenens sp.]
MKDHIRDYATAAFRYYAELGCPTYELLKKQIYDKALIQSKKELGHTNGISKPTEYAIMNAERAVENHEAELRDILAVQEVIERLNFKKNYDIVRAVRMVYFADADKPLEKGSISARVHQAELEIPASERQIYYWLNQARKIFAEERGLRIENRKTKNKKKDCSTSTLSSGKMYIMIS